MKKIISAKSIGAKLMLTTLAGFIVIVSFTMYKRYNSNVTMAIDGEFKRLRAISNSIKLQFDINRYDSLMLTNQKIDDIKNNSQDKNYDYLHIFLKNIQNAQNIKTDVYVLKFEKNYINSNKTPFYFTVTSGETPYYLHPYNTYPKELLQIGDQIGVIGPFADEHGQWLSSYAPIIKNDGSIEGIVMIDQKFDEFISEIRIKVIKELLLSVLFFGIIFSFIIYFIRKIIKIDALKKEEILQSKKEIEIKNQKIHESINYAQRIQASLVPDTRTLKDYLGDAFMFYHAKDVISGDFPWLIQKDNIVYVGAVDCTGHGVPGAMMSFVGYFLLNEINSHREKYSPSYILDNLNEKVKYTLKQDRGGANSRDGMDVALCKIDKDNGILEFSGAHRPLFLVRNNEIIEYKADRKPIGGVTLKNHPKNFTNHIINIHQGDCIYIFSDGITDQFGGEGEVKTKYSSKRIKELILRFNGISMDKMKEVFETDFKEWKGVERQYDDILLIGIKF